ncbi:MAG: monofunctional biosynthetic peptidoglycan transglycosylase [Pseudomonadota bacterium]
MRKIFISLAAVVGIIWFLGISVCFCTPPIAQLRWVNPHTTAYMRADEHKKIQHVWCGLSKISQHLQNAVVLAEDDQFFSHPGYDWEAIKRAYRVNLKRGKFSKGASTITMQVARNLYLYPHKSLLRKVREVCIALKMELFLPKKRILEIYLNIAEWGNGIYGAEAAARHYFGKSARYLTKEEAAWLASILPRPRFYDRNRRANLPHMRAEGIAGRL